MHELTDTEKQELSAKKERLLLLACRRRDKRVVAIKRRYENALFKELDRVKAEVADIHEKFIDRGGE